MGTDKAAERFPTKCGRTVMSKFFRKWAGFLSLAIMLLPSSLFAVGTEGAAVVVVADSRAFSGWRAWWMNLYNDSHLLFALLTIVIIPCVALVLGRLTGLVMARLGINLKSRDLAEH